MKDIFVDDRHANVRPGRPGQGEHRPNYDRHDRVMNDQLFKTFYNNLKKEPFEDDRMALLNTALANSDFTSAQCLQVTKLYTFDDDRMAIMKKMYPRIVDKEAFFTVIATLTFSSNKDEMHQAGPEGFLFRRKTSFRFLSLENAGFEFSSVKSSGKPGGVFPGTNENAFLLLETAIQGVSAQDGQRKPLS